MDTTNTASDEALNPNDIEVNNNCQCDKCIYDAQHAYDDSCNDDNLPF